LSIGDLTGRVGDAPDVTQEIAGSLESRNDAFRQRRHEIGVERVLQCLLAEEDAGVTDDDPIDDAFFDVTFHSDCGWLGGYGGVGI